MYKKNIIEILSDKDYSPKTYEEIIDSNIEFTKNKSEIKEFLKELLFLGIIEQSGQKFKLSTKIYIGQFDNCNKFFGFVRPINQSQDLYIHYKNKNKANNGDLVIAKEIKTKYTKEGDTEGKILYILEKGEFVIVGTYQKNKGFGFVIPDDERYNDIFIQEKKSMNARNDDKVIAKIIKDEEHGKKCTGKIVEILGNKNDKNIDILSIVKTHKIEPEFPKQVLEEANKISSNISDNELKKELKIRKDLRNLNIITIDGNDTKDFDDAVSISKLKNGKYKLGVHIADVTHYVKEESHLDKEALKRGTSVYLVNKVIPMLPEKLSNGICSLNPKVDRFTLSCFMEIDKDGNVLNTEIEETVIKTVERMTYDDVNKIIENKDNSLINKYQHILKDLQLMNELRIILNKKREIRGSIDFNLPETKVILDKNGKPIDIKLYEHNSATNLIEEFMIVCNEAVSEYFTNLEIPFLYRIHEIPSEDKINEFKSFMNAIGCKSSFDMTNPKSLQILLKEYADMPQYEQISQIMLRNLSKARYSNEPKGHFGLSSIYYSHFTSPIRRYPDLQIHRIIKEYLHGVMNSKRKNHYENILSPVALNCSKNEISAYECERETTALKICEYMKGHIGEILDGKVSGITSKKIYVELPNTIEGYIPIEYFNKNNQYYFDEKCFSYKNNSDNETVFTFGTKVKIEVMDVDTKAKKVIFKLI